jgi:tetratricopeptide (TPR) repeat protein
MQRALGLGPADAAKFATFSASCLKQGDVDGAIAAGHLATACDGNLFEAWLTYGSALAKAKRDPDAIVALKRAIALRPEQLSTHVHLGEVYLRVLDYQGASSEFRLVMEIDPKGETPEGARAQVLVARTLMALG